MKESDATKNTAPDLEEALSPVQVCSLLKINYSTLLAWRREHGFPAIRLKNGHVRIFPSKLQDWLRTHSAPESPDHRNPKTPGNEGIASTAKTTRLELETLLTPAEVAQRLNVDIKTLRVYRRELGLPVIRMKRAVRILPSALKEWLQRLSSQETTNNQPKAAA